MFLGDFEESRYFLNQDVHVTASMNTLLLSPQGIAFVAVRLSSIHITMPPPLGITNQKGCHERRNCRLFYKGGWSLDLVHAVNQYFNLKVAWQEKTPNATQAELGHRGTWRLTVGH